MTTKSKQRVTLFINPGILKHAKAEAVLEGISFTALTERALIKYLPEETIINKVKIKGGS